MSKASKLNDKMNAIEESVNIDWESFKESGYFKSDFGKSYDKFLSTVTDHLGSKEDIIYFVDEGLSSDQRANSVALIKELAKNVRSTFVYDNHKVSVGTYKGVKFCSSVEDFTKCIMINKKDRNKL